MSAQLLHRIFTDRTFDNWSHHEEGSKGNWPHRHPSTEDMLYKLWCLPAEVDNRYCCSNDKAHKHGHEKWDYDWHKFFRNIHSSLVYRF